jgi:hypothetical protein
VGFHNIIIESSQTLASSLTHSTSSQNLLDPNIDFLFLPCTKICAGSENLITLVTIPAHALFFENKTGQNTADGQQGTFNVAHALHALTALLTNKIGGTNQLFSNSHETEKASTC